jgi:hypothetical protein
MKSLPIKCINIKLLDGGKQQATFEKAAATPTSKLPNGQTVVNSPDISVTVITEAPSDNYTVGKDYQLSIN